MTKPHLLSILLAITIITAIVILTETISTLTNSILTSPKIKNEMTVSIKEMYFTKCPSLSCLKIDVKSDTNIDQLEVTPDPSIGMSVQVTHLNGTSYLLCINITRPGEYDLKLTAYSNGALLGESHIHVECSGYK